MQYIVSVIEPYGFIHEGEERFETLEQAVENAKFKQEIFDEARVNLNVIIETVD